MVTTVTNHGASLGLLAVERAAEPVLEQLDPPRRAAVVMALLALVLTGVALVACVMIGARWVRRLAAHNVRPTPTGKSPGRQPWRDVLRKVLPDAKSSDTIIDTPSDETRVDP